MGTEKYQNEIRELFKKSPVISFSSIARIINKRKKVKQYPKQLVRNLILSGRIKKVAKGYYSLSDDPSLSVFCFKPAYLGLQDALSFHNLWEQETIPVIVTTRKVRPGIRKIMGMNVLIRRMETRYFFGFDYYQDGDFYLPYSDKEKTLIDMVYFKESLSKEAIKNLAKNIDKKKLNKYLQRYPKKLRKKVLLLLNKQPL